MRINYDNWSHMLFVRINSPQIARELLFVLVCSTSHCFRRPTYPGVFPSGFIMPLEVKGL